MDWDDLRIFCAAAQVRTLSAAARGLGTSIATVARRISALEAALGFRLFDRAPEGIALTTQGRALFERASAAAAAMDGVGRLAVALRASQWSDPIRVSATEPIISEILAPALPQLLAAAPGIRVDLSSTTDVVSLAAREADVAVRFARPVGDSLIIRRLPSFDLGLFARSRIWPAAGQRASICTRSACSASTPATAASPRWRGWRGSRKSRVARATSMAARRASAAFAPVRDRCSSDRGESGRDRR